ncbi:MAG: helix-turn-helix transcriptional regulator [Myxococcota bacterium]
MTAGRPPTPAIALGGLAGEVDGADGATATVRTLDWRRGSRRAGPQAPPVAYRGRVRHRRAHHHPPQARVTQAEMADALGISQALVSKYERGELLVNAELLGQFATALRVSADELLGLQKRKPSAPLPHLPPPSTEASPAALLNSRRFPAATGTPSRAPSTPSLPPAAPAEPTQVVRHLARFARAGQEAEAPAR